MVNSFQGDSSPQDRHKIVPLHSCCLSQSQLEEYIFNRLSGTELDRVEEHLLVCTDCQDRLQEEEEFIAAFREASSSEPLGLPVVEEKVSLVARVGAWLSAPISKPALAGVGALALVLAVWVPTAVSNTPQVVMLEVERGGTLLDSALVSSRSVVELNVDLREIPTYSSYRMELVDGNGKSLSEKTLPAQSAVLSWKLGKKLSSGNYWVRLYTVTGNELLREFQLRVE